MKLTTKIKSELTHLLFIARSKMNANQRLNHGYSFADLKDNRFNKSTLILSRNEKEYMINTLRLSIEYLKERKKKFKRYLRFKKYNLEMIEANIEKCDNELSKINEIVISL